MQYLRKRIKTIFDLEIAIEQQPGFRALVVLHLLLRSGQDGLGAAELGLKIHQLVPHGLIGQTKFVKKCKSS